MKTSESENMAAWVAELRTTDRLQGHGALHSFDPEGDEPAQFCCLGVGCEVAMVRGQVFTLGAEDGESSFGMLRLYDDRSDLAPISFGRWLGFSYTELTAQNNGDFLLDWPVEWLRPTAPESWAQSGTKGGETPVTKTSFRLSILNDDGLTFAQIADLIEYFGIVAW